jgi:hypothetical protein
MTTAYGATEEGAEERKQHIHRGLKSALDEKMKGLQGMVKPCPFKSWTKATLA